MVKTSCREEKKGKNKRVVDSFTLQRPILDYISGSCFLCAAFLWPGPKKREKKPAKISFNLPCRRNSSVRPPRFKQGRQLSNIGCEITLIISLSAAAGGRGTSL